MSVTDRSALQRRRLAQSQFALGYWTCVMGGQARPTPRPARPHARSAERTSSLFVDRPLRRRNKNGKLQISLLRGSRSVGPQANRGLGGSIIALTRRRARQNWLRRRRTSAHPGQPSRGRRAEGPWTRRYERQQTRSWQTPRRPHAPQTACAAVHSCTVLVLGLHHI